MLLPLIIDVKHIHNLYRELPVYFSGVPQRARSIWDATSMGHPAHSRRKTNAESVKRTLQTTKLAEIGETPTVAASRYFYYLCRLVYTMGYRSAIEQEIIGNSSTLHRQTKCITHWELHILHN